MPHISLLYSSCIAVHRAVVVTVSKYLFLHIVVLSRVSDGSWFVCANLV